jgi:hypothetical protein
VLYVVSIFLFPKTKWLVPSHRNSMGIFAPFESSRHECCHEEDPRNRYRQGNVRRSFLAHYCRLVFLRILSEKEKISVAQKKTTKRLNGQDACICEIISSALIWGTITPCTSRFLTSHSVFTIKHRFRPLHSFMKVPSTNQENFGEYRPRWFEHCVLNQPLSIHSFYIIFFAEDCSLTHAITWWKKKTYVLNNA